MPLTWTAETSPAYNFFGAAWSPTLGRFVAVGGNSPYVAYSDDGITWHDGTLGAGFGRTWLDVVWSPELALFVATGQAGSVTVAASTDGITWTRPTSQNGSWFGVTWSPSLGMFVAVNADTFGHPVTEQVMTSTNGTTWSYATASEHNAWGKVTWSPALGMFAAVAAGGTHRVMTSIDGTNWSNQTAAEANTWTDIAWSPSLGIFAAVADSGTGNQVMTSANGTLWSSQTAASTDAWTKIIWSPTEGMFVAVANSGAGGRIMTSTNGTTWTIASAPATKLWAGLAYASSLRRFVAVARDTSTTIAVMRGDALSDSITPTGGNAAGGNTITLTSGGSNGGFQVGVTRVFIDQPGWVTQSQTPTLVGNDWVYPTGNGGYTIVSGVNEATNVVVSDANNLTCVLPVGKGASDIIALNVSTILAPHNIACWLPAGYTYASPVLTGIAPSSGPIAGGSSLTVTGTNLFGMGGSTTPTATQVVFSGTSVPATNVTVVNPTTITLTTPALPFTGLPVDVKLQATRYWPRLGSFLSYPESVLSLAYTPMTVWADTPLLDGLSSLAPDTHLLYQLLSPGSTWRSISAPVPTVLATSPSEGVLTGGTSISIYGSGFVNGVTVTIGGNAATVQVVNAFTIFVPSTPAHAVGAVNVVVTNPDGQFGTLTNGFTYTNLPLTISSAVPSSGTSAGNTTVTIHGTNFITGATVMFGHIAGTVTFVDSQTLSVVTPAHYKGIVDITVTNP